MYSQVCLLYHERFRFHIFMDECTVELVRHNSFYRMKDSPNQIKLVGRYAHETSVHVIRAISRRGATSLYIIQGSLNSNGLQFLLNRFLLPFIRSEYSDHHCLYIDGAGHHTSDSTLRYFYANNINLAVHPAQSPDFNPIELIWNDLKRYLRTKIQPNSLAELVAGIMRFWQKKVTVEKCFRLIY